MQTDPLYVYKLEHIIKNQLLPVFCEYYKQRGEAVPDLDLGDLLPHKVPALCRPWPIKAGVLTFTSHR